MLERSDDPSVEELTQIMEVTRMHETYYTPEQLAQLDLLDGGVHFQRVDQHSATVAEPR